MHVIGHGVPSCFVLVEAIPAVHLLGHVSLTFGQSILLELVLLLLSVRVFVLGGYGLQIGVYVSTLAHRVKFLLCIFKIVVILLLVNHHELLVGVVPLLVIVYSSTTSLGLRFGSRVNHVDGGYGRAYLQTELFAIDVYKMSSVVPILML